MQQLDSTQVYLLIPKNGTLHLHSTFLGENGRVYHIPSVCRPPWIRMRARAVAPISYAELLFVTLTIHAWCANRYLSLQNYSI